jgi:hypothetical protein
MPTDSYRLKPPFPMPRPADFPGVTTFRHAECAAAAHAYQAVPPQLTGSIWLDSARQFAAWFEQCDTLGEDLVIFYY